MVGPTRRCLVPCIYPDLAGKALFSLVFVAPTNIRTKTKYLKKADYQLRFRAKLAVLRVLNSFTRIRAADEAFSGDDVPWPITRERRNP